MIIINYLKKLRAKHQFNKLSTLKSNVQIKSTAVCINPNRDKSNIKIGNNSLIMGKICALCGETIEIGDNFYIGQNSMIGASNSIKIGNCVIISNDVCIYDNNTHPTSPKAREKMSLNGFSNDNWSWRHAESSPVVIEDNVWIGQYTTILKGVTIGRGSVIATRAVVTKDVPPYTIVAGNPAKVVKYLEH